MKAPTITRPLSPPARLRIVIAMVSAASLAMVGCAPHPDPRVQAAENFRSTVFDLIAQDDDQTKRLNALRLGMSDREVLDAAGAPTTREGRLNASGGGIETWTYVGQLSTLGTLTFENSRLVEIQTY